MRSVSPCVTSISITLTNRRSQCKENITSWQIAHWQTVSRAMLCPWFISSSTHKLSCLHEHNTVKQNAELRPNTHKGMLLQAAVFGGSMLNHPHLRDLKEPINNLGAESLHLTPVCTRLVAGSTVRKRPPCPHPPVTAAPFSPPAVSLCLQEEPG